MVDAKFISPNMTGTNTILTSSLMSTLPNYGWLIPPSHFVSIPSFSHPIYIGGGTPWSNPASPFIIIIIIIIIDGTQIRQ